MDLPTAVTVAEVYTVNKLKRKARGNLDTQKCDRCRKDKVKCKPHDRVWPEKCARCKVKDLPCSENMRAKRRRQEELPAQGGVGVELDAAQEQPRDRESWSPMMLAHSVSLLRILKTATFRQRTEMAKMKTLFTLEGQSPIKEWPETHVSRFAKKLQAALDYEVLRQLHLESGSHTERGRTLLQQVLCTIHMPAYAPCKRIHGVTGICGCGKVSSKFAISALRESGDYGAAILLWDDHQVHSPDIPAQDVLDWIDLQQKFKACLSGLPPDLEGDEDWKNIQGGPFLFNPDVLGWLIFEHFRISEHREVCGALRNMTDCLGKTIWHLVVECAEIHFPVSMVDKGLRRGQRSWQRDVALGLFRGPIAGGMDAGDHMGQTPLHTAAMMNDWKLSQAAVEAGLNIDSQTASGSTALHYSAVHGFATSCELLLQGGADPNIRDDAGATPLHYAIGKGHVQVAKLLIKAGKTVLTLEMDGDHTPLSLAVKCGHAEIVDLLIEQDVSDGVCDKKYIGDKLLLHLAMHSKDRTIIEKLLKLPDLNVNQQDEHGRTALMLAVDNDDEDTVRAILAHLDTDASVATDWGRCALHFAAVRGRISTCALIAQRWDGGRLMKDRDGKYPRDLARNFGAKDIADFLTRLMQGS